MVTSEYWERLLNEMRADRKTKETITDQLTTMNMYLETVCVKLAKIEKAILNIDILSDHSTRVLPQ